MSRARLTVAVAVALAAALAGCTSPQPEPQVATASRPTASAAAPTPSPAKETDYDKALRFTRCMNDLGETIPDPVEGKPIETASRKGHDGWAYTTANNQ